MSLGIVISAPEGIVLAAESRVTVTGVDAGGAPQAVTFDTAQKILHFTAEPHRHVGIVTWGAGAIGLRTANSYMPELEASLPPERLTIKEYAEKVSTFFTAQWNTHDPAYSGNPMIFAVAGFDAGQVHGEAYLMNVPKPGTVHEWHARGAMQIGWGGQTAIVDRLVKGYDRSGIDQFRKAVALDAAQTQSLEQALAGSQMGLPIASMGLQGCVDLAVFLVRSTIEGQMLSICARGCGGAIDVAVVTRSEGLQFIRKKTLTVTDGSHRSQP